MEVKELVEIAVPLIGIPVAGILLFKHHFASHNHAKRLLKYNNLEECMTELENIRKAKDLHIENEWNLYQNLVHCAQSIEFSMAGFPESKPPIIQKTIGSLVFHQFEKQGYMRHNRSEPIPGSTPIEAGGSVDQAVARLSKAVIDFENFKSDLKPHFAYGKLSKSQFAQAHCMHIADHFAMMTY